MFEMAAGVEYFCYSGNFEEGVILLNMRAQIQIAETARDF
jgi:hypothetical protein